MSKSSTRFGVITTAMREAEEGRSRASCLFVLVSTNLLDELSRPFSILGLHSRFIRVPSSWSYTVPMSGDTRNAYATKKDVEK